MHHHDTLTDWKKTKLSMHLLTLAALTDSCVEVITSAVKKNKHVCYNTSNSAFKF